MRRRRAVNPFSGLGITTKQQATSDAMISADGTNPRVQKTSKLLCAIAITGNKVFVANGSPLRDLKLRTFYCPPRPARCVFNKRVTRV